MEETLTLPDTLRILCVSRSLLNDLVNDFLLTRVIKDRRASYTKKSVLRYLARPSVLFHATPQAWIEIWRDPKEEVITLPQVTRRFGVSEYTRNWMLTTGVIPYIKTPGGDVRLPARATAVAAVELRWFSFSRLMKHLRITTCFAEALIANHLLCNHEPTELRCPRPACLRDFMKCNATHPSLDADDWWRAMLNGVTLTTGEEATKILGRVRVQQAVETGELVGFRLPAFRRASNRPIRFLQSDVLALQVHAMLHG